MADTAEPEFEPLGIVAQLFATPPPAPVVPEQAPEPVLDDAPEPEPVAEVEAVVEPEPVLDHQPFNLATQIFATPVEFDTSPPPALPAPAREPVTQVIEAVSASLQVPEQYDGVQASAERIAQPVEEPADEVEVGVPDPAVDAAPDPVLDPVPDPGYDETLVDGASAVTGGGDPPPIEPVAPDLAVEEEPEPEVIVDPAAAVATDEQEARRAEFTRGFLSDLQGLRSEELSEDLIAASAANEQLAALTTTGLSRRDRRKERRRAKAIAKEARAAQEQTEIVEPVPEVEEIAPVVEPVEAPVAEEADSAAESPKPSREERRALRRAERAAKSAAKQEAKTAREPEGAPEPEAEPEGLVSLEALFGADPDPEPTDAQDDLAQLEQAESEGLAVVTEATAEIQDDDPAEEPELSRAQRRALRRAERSARVAAEQVAAAAPEIVVPDPDPDPEPEPDPRNDDLAQLEQAESEGLAVFPEPVEEGPADEPVKPKPRYVQRQDARRDTRAARLEAKYAARAAREQRRQEKAAAKRTPETEIVEAETAPEPDPVGLAAVPLHQHIEVIDPSDEPEDTLPGDWLPGTWEPRRLPRGGRGRRRAERARTLPFVTAPHVPRRKQAAPEKARTRAGKVVRVSLVVALIGGAAAVPWLVPQVPDWLASSVPEQALDSPKITDPKVEPSGGFVGPVGIEQADGPYLGVRLTAAGRPLEVDVPRLHVSSDVIPISGQTGELVPPDDPQVLGWWQEGQEAGEMFGSAVITGHTVHTGGGAFDQLPELVPGDTIRVRTAKGWIKYVVRRSRIYSVAGLAKNAEDIFRLGGDGRLVLITCSDFDGRVYRSNAVVYAIPVLDQPIKGKPARPSAPSSAGTQVPDGGPGDAA